MGNCTNHPDRETPYLCQKLQIYMCSGCMTCRSPEIYCKFRTACAIHFRDKEKKREAAAGS